MVGRKQGGVRTAQPERAAVIGPRAAAGSDSEVDSQESGSCRKGSCTIFELFSNHRFYYFSSLESVHEGVSETY